MRKLQKYNKNKIKSTISDYLWLQWNLFLGYSNLQTLHHTKWKKDNLESRSIGSGGKTNAMYQT